MILGHGITSVLSRVLLLFYGYKSHQALAGGHAAETHWLTFWTLYAFLQILGAVSDSILYWVPFYFELRLALYVWLGLFNGAELVYEKFAKDAIKAAEGHAKQLSERPQVKQLLQTVDSKLAPLKGSLGAKTQ
eukprot:TRINITY_DN670_c0_g1_i1.p1 TRINITY_DN670_c0_g1~~TRINITY_DN670_c0_g1_i1.p1  ORF type:complete len:148 (-),score=54.70 TRINITY_DN670_c0_g1_i1:263-661(-)